MCEKNIFHLFRFSQSVEKTTYFINRLDCSCSSWKIYGIALAGFADLWNFVFVCFFFFFAVLPIARSVNLTWKANGDQKKVQRQR